MFNRFYLEWLMQSPLIGVVINLILTLLIVAAAYLGGTLGIEGIALEFSLIWPAAGISLAAVLLFGYRVLPGVLLGNFSYNFFELYSYDPEIISNLLAASFVALGSMIQALLGGYIIRKYSSQNYFKDLRDILIFIIPAGLLTCILASTVGNFTIYLYGGLIHEDIFTTWITFWLGDLMGVYIFTPLIVIWVLNPAPRLYKLHILETLGIVVLFVFISYTIFILNYRFTQLYLVLCIWVTFRYSFHGATLIIFFTTVLTVFLTSLGYGPFKLDTTAVDPLIYLVSFIEVVVATTLILAAVLKERAESKKLIVENNVELQNEVTRQLKEIRDIYNDMFLKEKQASIGNKTFEISRQIQLSLDRIRNSAKKIQPEITGIKEVVSSFPSKMATETFNSIETIGKNLNSIMEAEERANRIAIMIQEHIKQSSKETLDIKTVNLHLLIEYCLKEVIERMKFLDEFFDITIEKRYDSNVTSFTALPWELEYAFCQFFEFSLHSLKTKKELLSQSYKPLLEINTYATENDFTISIKDNGKGTSTKKLETLFKPFQGTEIKIVDPDLGLSLAYDIIVHIHRGKIEVDSIEGDYFHIVISLPKQTILKSNL